MGKSFRIDESSIYGRNDDKEAIIERLLSTDDQANSNGNLQVISIVGIGGIGKTFLTKLVYSDARVQEWFDVKIWICAATKFDLLKLAKDILEEVTCDTSISAHDDHILLELKEKLIGKKFLLILDDVWNDNRVEWSFLLSYLECGAQGSKIIVTTRNRSVALALGAAQSYFLSELGDDHCWNLFAKHAFSDEQCCSDPNHRVI
ncbi:conserved hypothetical protein [Ricinus communis]|uniref:NB-ARC domain-containing protein n=1 Tax=Ricinus communis TaxID=3988 RepID=B9SC69_RICCO|nr:conserved hypothetical protein [Ricinus communis]